jgi:HemY protein
MKNLFWVLALFVLAVGASLAMRFNEGYVLLVLPPYEERLSLDIAIPLLVGALVLFHFLVRAVSMAYSVPRRVGEFRLRRERERSAKAFGESLRLFLGGSFRESIAKAAEVRGEGDWSALAALVTARATKLLGESGERPDRPSESSPSSSRAN